MLLISSGVNTAILLHSVLNYTQAGIYWNINMLVDRGLIYKSGQLCVLTAKGVLLIKDAERELKKSGLELR